MKKRLNHILYKYFLRRWKLWLVIFLTLIPLFYGLIWLILLALLLLGLYKCVFYTIGWIQSNFLKKLLRNIFLFLWVIILSICTKIFGIELYKIPSGSMENTLFPEDTILVNKLIYGPKLPQNPFEVSWINLLFYLNDNARKAIEDKWWPYYRFKGINNIQQGDVLVYQPSKDHYVVKRCIATAGDTLSLIDGEICTNNKKYLSPITVKNRFQFKIKKKFKFLEQKDSLIPDAIIYSISYSTNSFVGELTMAQVSKIKNISGVYDFKKMIDTFDHKNNLFAMPIRTKWSIDNMGPIVVPKSGMNIKLTPYTYSIYKHVIENQEKVKLEKKDDLYYLSGKERTSYTFKQNYLFVIGDNRKDSVDSRYIGFIPEENIVGKVQYVVLSNYHSMFRWDRFLKQVF